MISIIADDPKGMYMNLLSPRVQRNSEDDLIKETLSQLISDEDKVKTIVGGRSFKKKCFSTGHIYLPYPMDNLWGFFYSDGLNYSGNFIFDINSEHYKKNEDAKDEIFKNVTTKLGTSKDVLNIGGAILFVYDKDPYFVFGKYPHNSFRLDFGTSGTMKRTLVSLEQFEEDINNLTDNLTKIINAFYTEETPDIDYRLYVN